jgi:hypothetical protein
MENHNSETKNFDCNQKQCTVRTTGLCLEGLKVEECPHSSLFIDDDNTIAIEEDGEITISAPAFSFYSGEDLKEEEISNITFSKTCKLIVLMGDPNCGKTSLLGSVFDQFNKGAFADYLFAGSRTLVGFERKCYLARLASGRTTSDSERTKASYFHYLHIAIRKQDLSNKIQHLLFADIAGEQFRMARDYEKEMQQLKVLRRADHLFLIADGELLIDLAQRHSAKEDVFKLLGRALQTNMISEHSTLNVLITKLDLITHRNQEDYISSFFIEPLIKRFPKINKVIKVAARPKYGNIQPGTGLDEFLRVVVSEKKLGSEYAANFNITREFQKFKYR